MEKEYTKADMELAFEAGKDSKCPCLDYSWGQPFASYDIDYSFEKWFKEEYDSD